MAIVNHGHARGFVHIAQLDLRGNIAAIFALWIAVSGRQEIGNYFIHFG